MRLSKKSGNNTKIGTETGLGLTKDLGLENSLSRKFGCSNKVLLLDESEGCCVRQAPPRKSKAVDISFAWLLSDSRGATWKIASYELV